MATTTIHVSSMTHNTVLADPAGTAIDADKTGVITPTRGWRKLLLRITNTTAAQKVVTVTAGDSPPADAAGLGALDITCAAGNVTAVVKYVVLESARFAQSDGTIELEYADATTGFVEAIQLP